MSGLLRGLVGLCWLLVQPWLVWPSLATDSSHRLTLVSCAVGLGLVTCSTSGPRQALPATWTCALSLLAGSIVWHALPIVRAGGYFEHFRETALACDGMLVLLACWWGAWALRQVPRAWFHALPWCGLAMLLLNAVYVVAQAAGQGWHLGGYEHQSGVLGMDRLLGAYALAWLPICWVWRRWLVVLPMALIVASGKVLVLGAAVMTVCWLLTGRWRWLPLLGLLAIPWVHTGLWGLQITQRLKTYGALVSAIGERPWAGWGFAPMTLTTLQQQHPGILPSLHSDWLALAFHAGVLVVVAVLLVWGRVVLSVPKTRWAHAVQASLVGLGVLAASQHVVGHARLGGLAIVFMIWWLHEQAEEARCDTQHGV